MGFKAVDRSRFNQTAVWARTLTPNQNQTKLNQASTHHTKQNTSLLAVLYPIFNAKDNRDKMWRRQMQISLVCNLTCSTTEAQHCHWWKTKKRQIYSPLKQLQVWSVVPVICALAGKVSGLTGPSVCEAWFFKVQCKCFSIRKPIKITSSIWLHSNHSLLTNERLLFVKTTTTTKRTEYHCRYSLSIQKSPRVCGGSDPSGVAEAGGWLTGCTWPMLAAGVLTLAFLAPLIVISKLGLFSSFRAHLGANCLLWCCCRIWLRFCCCKHSVSLCEI